MNPYNVVNKIPVHIPSSCTEKLSLRLEPWRRTIVEFCANKNRTSMSEEVLKAIDLYFIDQVNRNKWELMEKSKDKFIQLSLFNWVSEK